MVIAFYHILIDLTCLDIGKLIGILNKFPDTVFRFILDVGEQVAVAVNIGELPGIIGQKDRSVDHSA